MNPRKAPTPGEGDRVAGRLRLTRLLRQGQGIATFLATDEAHGSAVVVKMTAASAVSTAARLRLQHESGALAPLRGPCLAPPVEVGSDGDLLYLVAPFVAGVTLRERLQRGPLSVRETLVVGRCLLSALSQAHGIGVLHRDVKPGNLILDEGSPCSRATLIDFGLARTGQLGTSLRDLPVEMVRYLAPEQAGLLRHDVGERSDLYAAGLVLYECLAGRPAFEGGSLHDVLRQHLTHRPPELRSLALGEGSAVPRALDDLVQRLLRKDPRDRYQSARAVLADLDDLARAWDQGDTEPTLVTGLRDRRDTLAEPAFVGRTSELAVVDQWLTRIAKGSAALLLLEAGSGGGKTRFLDEVEARAARRGAWVLRGQDTGRAARRPHQILQDVVARVVAAARAEAPLAEAIREKLQDQSDSACAAIPQLAAILRQSRTMMGPEELGEARTLPAVATLLDALGTRQRPAVLLLDDCQWADEFTVKLLDHWLRRRAGADAPGPPVLILAAFQSEEVPLDQPLRQLEPSTHLVLPPLAETDVRRLAESMAGPLPEEAVDLVYRLSEGNPFMAEAVLRGLVESGALTFGADGWAVERQAMSDVQSSRQAGIFLTRRLDSLSKETLWLLSVGALLGREFELDVAAALAGRTAPQAVATIAEARRRHLVWGDAQEARWIFVHDKVREALLGRLAEGERRHSELAVLPESKSLPEISVAIPEIESALLNLVTNALDAAPDGGSVPLSARGVGQPGIVRLSFVLRASFRPRCSRHKVPLRKIIY